MYEKTIVIYFQSEFEYFTMARKKHVYALYYSIYIYYTVESAGVSFEINKPVLTNIISHNRFINIILYHPHPILYNNIKQIKLFHVRLGGNILENWFV